MAADSKKSVEDLIGHAMSDKEFRARLLKNPEETLKAEGYDVGPEVIEAIKNANPEDAGAFESGSAERKAAF